MPDKSLLVSIGIPTYNRCEGYFRETLASALAQTYPNIEIIIGDNGSTDNTEAYVQSIDDARIRYFKHQPSLVPNDNFNFLAREARGDYFLLLHDDDVIDRDFIEVCMKAAAGNRDYGIIRTGVRIIDDNGVATGEMDVMPDDRTAEDLFVSWLDSKTAMILCSTLFNTRYLQEIGGIHSKHNLFNDVLTEFKLVARNGYLSVPGIKAGFRKHSMQSTFNVKLKEWCEDSRQLLDAMVELAQERKDEIRSKGLYHLARHNYDIASQLKPVWKKMAAFSFVNNYFDGSYPMFSYLNKRYVRPWRKKYGLA